MTKEWLDHPLVRHARGALPADHSTLDLLEETLRLMIELEERFPEMNFAEILSADELSDAQAVRQHLTAAGVSEADIDILIGARAPSDVRRFTPEQLSALGEDYRSFGGGWRQFCMKHDIPRSSFFRWRKAGWEYAE